MLLYILEQELVPMIIERTSSAKSILLDHQVISGTCFALVRAHSVRYCAFANDSSICIWLASYCCCMLLNWAPILNCASHTLTKESMFDRKIRIKNIDAGTISDPHTGSANMCARNGWKQDCVQSNQYFTRKLFSLLEFPMHGWHMAHHGCPSNPSIWSETDEQTKVDGLTSLWMKARATPICYIVALLHPSHFHWTIHTPHTSFCMLYLTFYTLVSDSALACQLRWVIWAARMKSPAVLAQQYPLIMLTLPRSWSWPWKIFFAPEAVVRHG